VSEIRDEDTVLVDAFTTSRRVEDFEPLIARHQQMVFRVAVSVLGPNSERDAEDVAQDVFLQLFRRIGDFQRRSKFSSWLYRIAYNRALDRRRALRARPDLAPLEIDRAARPSERDVLRSRAIDDCLTKLPDAHRTAIHLHYWLGHTMEEIAQTLGIQSGTAKSWLFRARHLVARCLASKGVHS
jgi:RNA polymerase sigma-70 factor, ECF subfamily